MHFESFNAFLAMGGYAAYVWSAFGITAAAMLALIVGYRRTHKKRLQAVKQQIAREQRIKDAQALENTL
ncbi:heme exporter protein CcmD [Salinivibrio kushneri]|uniref:Heme exporter protein D n=1 Tax=Salinivibrio kushneri TaxID=1908198 RepID=A0AA47KJG1_9GAMM|nr:heme exporter protein CcmD [Salinivibrio kushneri]WBA08050.1 heme exporter protein CcmD [Salinivibrio kushneri]